MDARSAAIERIPLMDVRPSPEQVALRDSVVHVVERLAPRSVNEIGDAERTPKLDAAVDAAGWRDLRTPNESGAPWASAVEAAIVAEELSRGLADAPFLGPTLAAELRRLAGAPLAAERETVVFAGVAIDAAGATSALAVDVDAVTSVAVLPEQSVVDITRPSSAIDESGKRTSIGERSADDLLRWTALGLALTSADLVGVMRGAVTLARDYAIDRKQYGTAIGSFQAVQHLLADAHVAMEGSRSAALHAAWAVDALSPAEAIVAGAVAKAYCARAALTTCETAIQVHGGIGNTWDCLAHVYLRRALLAVDVFGGVGPNLDRVLEHHGVDDGLR
jgi:alkylation response protein AidB-like acyl-CoA dehydrogenase